MVFHVFDFFIFCEKAASMKNSVALVIFTLWQFSSFVETPS